jgi:flagellar basal-body rod modification protein FlgD
MSAFQTAQDAASTASTSASSSSAPSASANLASQNVFLQLLVAQLQNQDPEQPTDGTAFVTELAQFTTVQEDTQSAGDLDKIVADMSTLMGTGTAAAPATSTSTSGAAAGTPAGASMANAVASFAPGLTTNSSNS